jgi:hypothetical protein
MPRLWQAQVTPTLISQSTNPGGQGCCGAISSLFHQQSSYRYGALFFRKVDINMTRQPAGMLFGATAIKPENAHVVGKILNVKFRKLCSNKENIKFKIKNDTYLNYTAK